MTQGNSTREVSAKGVGGMKKNGKVGLLFLILVSFLTEVSVPNIAEGCLSQISNLPMSYFTVSQKHMNHPE